MTGSDLPDEALLAGRDPAAFEQFYLRHVDTLLGFFSRRTRDAELAADLTAETFAAALAGRHRFRPRTGAATSWLFGIAMNKLADAQRRGYAERRARRRLGMERIELTDADIARIDALGESTNATALVEALRPDQRDAIRAHVIEERSYGEVAERQHVSEAVVRKRVSRGLSAVRNRMGGRHD
jgi:RNA polymerase sigma factor (sigma-70 family)